MSGGAYLKVSKGLEFPVMALPCVEHMPAAGADQKEAARVFSVAVNRATQRLVMGVGCHSGFRSKWLNCTRKVALIRLPQREVLSLTAHTTSNE